MQELIIERTAETPEVKFNPESGTLKISGRAYSNNISQFYKPLITWLNEYIVEPKELTTLDLEIEYCNSIFNKLLLTFLEKAKLVLQKDKKLIIKWLHQKDDQDSMDDANRISKIIQFPIEKIEFE